MSRTKEVFSLHVLASCWWWPWQCLSWDGSGDAMLACNSVNKKVNHEIRSCLHRIDIEHANISMVESTSLNCHMLCGRINIVQSPDMYGVIFTIIINRQHWDEKSECKTASTITATAKWMTTHTAATGSSKKPCVNFFTTHHARHTCIKIKNKQNDFITGKNT